MKKTTHAHVSIKSMGQLTQAMPSPPSQLVADYARMGMAKIYENDKATENEVLERVSSSQEKMSSGGRT